MLQFFPPSLYTKNMTQACSPNKSSAGTQYMTTGVDTSVIESEPQQQVVQSKKVLWGCFHADMIFGKPVVSPTMHQHEISIL